MSMAELEKYKAFFGSDTLFRRARHCVTEESRTLQSLKALEQGDLAAFGKLLNEVNFSMRDDYEATGKELDAVFDIAMKTDGVIGSRMTGGGFGGCNISIVKKDSAQKFMQTVKDGYTKAIGYEPSFYKSDAGEGARELESWR